MYAKHIVILLIFVITSIRANAENNKFSIKQQKSLKDMLIYSTVMDIKKYKAEKKMKLKQEKAVRLPHTGGDHVISKYFSDHLAWSPWP